jgi:hypothetical protein
MVATWPPCGLSRGGPRKISGFLWAPSWGRGKKGGPVKLTTSPAQGSRRRGDRRRGHSRTTLACCFSDVKRLSCTGAGTQDSGGALHAGIWTIRSGDLPQGPTLGVWPWGSTGSVPLLAGNSIAPKERELPPTGTAGERDRTPHGGLFFSLSLDLFWDFSTFSLSSSETATWIRS